MLVQEILNFICDLCNRTLLKPHKPACEYWNANAWII